MSNLSIKQKIDREHKAINYFQSRFDLAIADNDPDTAIFFLDEMRRSMESLKHLDQQQEQLRQAINLLHEYGYHDLYELEKGGLLDERS